MEVRSEILKNKKEAPLQRASILQKTTVLIYTGNPC